jgi:hypothetical protein
VDLRAERLGGKIELPSFFVLQVMMMDDDPNVSPLAARVPLYMDCRLFFMATYRHFVAILSSPQAPPEAV